MSFTAASRSIGGSAARSFSASVFGGGVGASVPAPSGGFFDDDSPVAGGGGGGGGCDCARAALEKSVAPKSIVRIIARQTTLRSMRGIFFGARFFRSEEAVAEAAIAREQRWKKVWRRKVLSELSPDRQRYGVCEASSLALDSSDEAGPPDFPQLREMRESGHLSST